MQILGFRRVAEQKSGTYNVEAELLPATDSGNRNGKNIAGSNDVTSKSFQTT